MIIYSLPLTNSSLKLNGYPQTFSPTVVRARVPNELVEEKKVCSIFLYKSSSRTFNQIARRNIPFFTTLIVTSWSSYEMQY